MRGLAIMAALASLEYGEAEFRLMIYHGHQSQLNLCPNASAMCQAEAER